MCHVTTTHELVPYDTTYQDKSVSIYWRLTQQPYASMFLSTLFLRTFTEWMRSMVLLMIWLLQIHWYDKSVLFRIMDMECVFYSSGVLHTHDAYLTLLHIGRICLDMALQFRSFKHFPLGHPWNALCIIIKLNSFHWQHLIR